MLDILLVQGRLGVGARAEAPALPMHPSHASEYLENLDQRTFEEGRRDTLPSKYWEIAVGGSTTVGGSSSFFQLPLASASGGISKPFRGWPVFCSVNLAASASTADGGGRA